MSLIERAHAPSSPVAGEGAPPGAAPGIERRVAGLPWAAIAADLDAWGFATVPALLTPGECGRLIALYDQAERFRSRVIMARHGYGRGEYQYFAHPLPDLVAGLRKSVYPHLAPIANAWAERMAARPGAHEGRRFPPTLDELTAECQAAGQARPTPLLLKYGPDDHNCLHQDLYGDLAFPLQLAILLSQPGEDFSGGEFVLTEQRPRQQSRVEVVPLLRGDAVLFAVHHRPMAGARSDRKVNLRHGVSRVRHGQRFTLGVIFHDAR